MGAGWVGSMKSAMCWWFRQLARVAGRCRGLFQSGPVQLQSELAAGRAVAVQRITCLLAEVPGQAGQAGAPVWL